MTCLRVILPVISAAWPGSCSGRRCPRDWCGRCSLSCRAYSARIRRRCRSPWISRWSRHSGRSVPAYRFAKEFALGRPGRRLDDPPAMACEHLVEDRRERAVAVSDEEREPGGVSAEVHEQVAGLPGGPCPGGRAVTPRMCTRRVPISIAKKTCSRRRNTVSTCTSRARIPDAWEARNCRQAGDGWRGAAVSPASARTRRTVPAPPPCQLGEAHIGHQASPFRRTAGRGAAYQGAGWPARRR